MLVKQPSSISPVQHALIGLSAAPCWWLGCPTAAENGCKRIWAQTCEHPFLSRSLPADWSCPVSSVSLGLCGVRRTPEDRGLCRGWKTLLIETEVLEFCPCGVCGVGIVVSLVCWWVLEPCCTTTHPGDIFSWCPRIYTVQMWSGWTGEVHNTKCGNQNEEKVCFQWTCFKARWLANTSTCDKKYIEEDVFEEVVLIATADKNPTKPLWIPASLQERHCHPLCV